MNKYPLRIKKRNGEIKLEEIVDLDKEFVTLGYDPELAHDLAVQALQNAMKATGRKYEAIFEALHMPKSTFYSYKDFKRWPTKKLLIGVAFLAKYDLAAISQLLSLTNYDFDVKNQWDKVVIAQIEQGDYDLAKLNVELTKNGLEPLFGEA